MHLQVRLQAMHVAVTGGTGFIGSSLVSLLGDRGHRVTVISRRPGKRVVTWQDVVEGKALQGMDGVVHLAGEPLDAKRWTPNQKREIMQSRVRWTTELAQAIADMESPPRVLVSQSAVGFYGETSKPVDETAPRGNQFVSRVCEAWEAAAEPARAIGIRVVHPRTGVVLDRHGGALKRMLTPFRMGVGGPIGGGRQWLSWITLEDATAALLHCLENDSLGGPVNVVSPGAVEQRDFARALGKALHRPAVMPLPALAVTAMFGQMGRELLLAGQNVVPMRLQASGFQFKHDEVGEALRAVLAPKE